MRVFQKSKYTFSLTLTKYNIRGPYGTLCAFWHSGLTRRIPNEHFNPGKILLVLDLFPAWNFCLPHTEKHRAPCRAVKSKKCFRYPPWQSKNSSSLPDAESLLKVSILQLAIWTSRAWLLPLGDGAPNFPLALLYLRQLKDDSSFSSISLLKNTRTIR